MAFARSAALIAASFAALLADPSSTVGSECKPALGECKEDALRVSVGGCWKEYPFVYGGYITCEPGPQCCYATYKVCRKLDGTYTYEETEGSQPQLDCDALYPEPNSPCFEVCGDIPGHVQTGKLALGNGGTTTTRTTTAEVYPNPSTGTATIVCNDAVPGMAMVDISDATGTAITTAHAMAGADGTLRFEANLNGHPAGTYLYRVSNGAITFCTGSFTLVR